MNNMSTMSNMWHNNEESDDDYNDEDSILNEELPADIDEKFKKTVSNLKHTIYEATVLSPDLGTKKAQNNTVLEDYIKVLNIVNNLSKQAQKGKINKNELNKFPNEIQEPINNLLTSITDHSKNNSPADTVPYVDYIQNSFKVHPFVQKNSFNEE